MTCATCGNPERKIWPPRSKQEPNFVTIAVENWMELVRCPVCNALWAGVPYEPYAAFTYYVTWDRSEEEWRKEIKVNEGHPLHEWHQAQLQAHRHTLTSEDEEAIANHRARGRGERVDPYSQ